MKEAIHFAGAELDGYRHVCCFFQSQEEECRVLLPFVKEGIERCEKIFHIINPRLTGDHLRRLEEVGIDVAAAVQTGQLEVRSWENIYLHHNQFDPDVMLALVEEVFQRSRAEGYPLVRLIGQMEWFLGRRLHLNDLLMYEARLNIIVPKYNNPVICTYDLAKFGADVIMDVLRTHPMAVIGGVLHLNPFYIPPDEFLQELRSRSSLPPAS